MGKKTLDGCLRRVELQKAQITMSELLSGVEIAHNVALAHARDMYRSGNRVGVMLSRRQVYPSPATIRGVSIETYRLSSNGTTCAHVVVRVELDEAGARWKFRTVSPEALRDIEDVQ